VVSALRGRTIRWVFLDRDGTLNVKPPEGEYVESPEALELLPGAAAAVRALNRAGLWTALVTNQRGVALGRMSLADVEAVHARLRELLHLEDAHLDAIYTCPHQVGTCDCRKPQPGMLLRAQREHPNLDFADAAIIGDSLGDVEAGKQLGLMTMFISACGDLRGAGERTSVAADYEVASALDAVNALTAGF
jgi:D-glycero-D-manno-heptose 1,7-bisphosphate phosphatase